MVLCWPRLTTKRVAPVVSISWASCYPRDVVSAIYATATWLGGWLAGWVGGCLFVTAGIVSKRLNLCYNFLDHLVAPSFKHLGPLPPIPNSKGNPFSGGVKYTGVGKIGAFRAIFDGNRRLYRKRCEIGRWLLWTVNRKSWVPDLVV